VSPARFGIEASDVSLLKKLVIKYPSGYKSYSLFDFSNLEGALLWSKATRNYMGKFINKKLRFLYSYGLTYEDIESQLVEYALWVLRKHYPLYESDLHAQNICKTAIHNKGMLLIQYWTRQKRQTLSRSADGTFESKFLQLEHVANLGVRPEHESTELCDDLEKISKLLTARQSEILSLLKGDYDQGLSLYLGMSNVDAISTWDFNRYVSAVASYKMLAPAKVETFIKSLRSYL
jgi:hypothetical protein